MSFFDPFIVGVSEPVGASASASTRTTQLDKIVTLIEKRKRNTLFEPYVWRHGMWEKTILRENVKQVEKRK